MRKFKIIFIIFVLFLSSCKQESSSIEKEIYSIEKQENNILINFNKDIISKEDKLFKIYFYISDFDTRYFDSIFYSFLEINDNGTLDIRIYENKLIVTDIYNTNYQSVIDLDNMYPTYFNEETINDWIILEINEQAKNFFNTTYEITNRSFFRSFQIKNIKSETTIDISIFVLNYIE